MDTDDRLRAKNRIVSRSMAGKWDILTNRGSILIAAALLVLSIGCRSTPPAVIDPAMAACVPASSTLVAGIDLDRLRASPLYGQLPPAARALLDPVKEAHSLMVASDGKELAVIARGPFQQMPVGATAVGRDLAISGTPGFLAGRRGAPDLIGYASTVASGNPVWIAAQGGAALPLTGNAANLNRLLRECEHAAMTLRLNGSVELALTAAGRTTDAAREVEETLRATITLAAAGEASRPDVAALLRSIRLTREDRTVRASVSAAPNQVMKLVQ